MWLLEDLPGDPAVPDLVAAVLRSADHGVQAGGETLDRALRAAGYWHGQAADAARATGATAAGDGRADAARFTTAALAVGSV